MKNKEVITLSNQLSTLSGLKGVALSVAIVKNKKLLDAEKDALTEGVKATEKYNEYDTKRIELAQKHAQKDEDGKPKVEGNTFVMEDMEAFNKELDVLREEYKEELDARDKQIEEFNELLEKESSVELVQVTKEDLPEDITVAQMEIISSFLKD